MSLSESPLSAEESESLYIYYVGWFVFLLVLLVLFKLLTRSAQDPSKQPAVVTAEFKKFQRNFLLVYLIMMAADWLQGPYVYALYTHYGFDKGRIGILFIVGFGASMLFGTFVGSMADRYGRKKMCLAFGVMYSLSCLTKHFGDYKYDTRLPLAVVAASFVSRVACSV
jgi:Na+/melibiose symporter-like transporter